MATAADGYKAFAFAGGILGEQLSSIVLMLLWERDGLFGLLMFAIFFFFPAHVRFLCAHGGVTCG